MATTPRRALEILTVGALILTVIGSITAAIGASARLNSYMLNRIAFGDGGAAIVNLAFALSLLGWFGVNIDLFSGTVQRLAVDVFDRSIPSWPVELFAGLVMTVTTVFGFRAINLLSILLVPVLMLVTVQLIAGALDVAPLTELMARESGGDLSFGDGVSAVVGAVIIGAVILPDVTRFIRHWTGGVYLVLVSYLVIEFIVTCAGGLAATALDDADLLNVMITMGIGGSAFAIVIFGSWVLNSLNLYSATLSVESTVSHLPNTLLIAALGALGTIAAFFNILDYFLDFLFYLAIVFVPVAGVVAVDYLFLRRSAYEREHLELQPGIRLAAVASWGLGACIALMGSLDWLAFTSVAAIDAMLVSAGAYFAMAKAFGGRS